MKKIIMLGLCAACVLSLTGCGNSSESKDESSTTNVANNSSIVEDASEIIDAITGNGGGGAPGGGNTTNNDSTQAESSASTEQSKPDSQNSDTPESTLKEYEQLALNFLTAIREGNTDTIIKSLYAPANNVVAITAEDIKYAIPRSDYDNLTLSNTPIEIDSSKKEILEDDSITYDVTAKCGSEEYTLTIRMLDEGGYKVLWNDVIAYNWAVNVPVGLEDVCIGDIKLPTDTAELVTNSDYGTPFKKVLITCVKKDQTFTGHNAAGLTGTKVRSPIKEGFADICLSFDEPITSEKAQEIFKAGLTAYSATFRAYDEHKSIAEITPLWADDVDEAYMKAVESFMTDLNIVNQFNYDWSTSTLSGEDARICLVGADTYLIWFQQRGTFQTNNQFCNPVPVDRLGMFTVKYNDSGCKLCKMYWDGDGMYNTHVMFNRVGETT